ncbi:restriction endonuclease [Kitasatospora sp. NBC_01287]|uniref:restriction endonuclease n=1 Tax=Kitasatospora sp. NBC_01287 TaxID=2903573 RepID=UPI00225C0D60|nr:restriction endonuclease [Kitasatospora sp. NBC_01287]MCX4745953.1 restriction endonuclease [Kitasatospora sp. NBC_01287]
MASDEESAQRGRVSPSAADESGGLAILGGFVALGVVLQTAAWLWGHPLTALAVLAGAAAVLFGVRAALRHTALGPPVRRFLQPVRAQLHAGVSARLAHVRTTVTTRFTESIEQWAQRPLQQAVPAEPAASYVRRPMDYTLEAFEAATPLRFEEMCRELLERDGFTDVQRVGGAGDLGADVVADDWMGRRVVLQCKRYAAPVTSESVQKFNGTARPVHGAAVPVIVALNGFTAPAAALATQQRLHLVDRERLARWGSGQHLYEVLDIDRGPGRLA